MQYEFLEYTAAAASSSVPKQSSPLTLTTYPHH